MKKLLVFLVLGVMLFATACDKIPGSEAKFTGAVEQLSQQEVLVFGNGQRILFKITQDTMITGDLRVGATVTVVYNGVLTKSEPAIGTAQKITAQ